ncbi:hypothetical protein DIPPA_09520 [Diplonema papillatum]|nr:hypothetical protein DIPPA_09520 [Diplonema papillatum]
MRRKVARSWRLASIDREIFLITTTREHQAVPRKKVSAFDIAAFSLVNEAGLHYGYQSHYKTLAVTNTANGLKNSGADERTIKDYAQVDYPQAL